MITSLPSTPFEARLQDAPTGGHWWTTIRDNHGTVVGARDDTGITEPTPGVYLATRTAPAAVGTYTLTWDDGVLGHTVDDVLQVSTAVAATELCTVADVRAADTALTNTPTSRDPHLTAVIQDASLMITTWTGVTFNVGQVPGTVRRACVETVIHWLRSDRALTNASPDQWEPGSPPQRMLPLIALDLLRLHKTPGIA